MKIGIVNDMTMAVESLRRVLSSKPSHQVAWVAKDGEEAVRMAQENKPDLILMDLVMPVMDGVEATRQIMAKAPCPILVVTASIDKNASLVFSALGAGALDAVVTPVLEGGAQGGELLLSKIQQIKILVAGISSEKPDFTQTQIKRWQADSLVVIGASAGGPAAICSILPKLKQIKASIVIVQHVDEAFVGSLARWLGEHCTLPIRIAEPGDVPQRGEILLAGRNEHLVMTSRNTLTYSREPKELSYCPSVDVFFESVANYWQGRLAGVILTGMGKDGAVGLKKLRQLGAATAAQDKASCAVYGMPKAAAEIQAAEKILPLELIPQWILDFSNENGN